MDAAKKIRSVIWVVNIVAILVFALLLIWSLTSRAEMSRLFAHVSYYLTFLLIVVWVAHVVLFGKAMGFSAVGLLKSYWPGILLALVLTIVVFTSVKVGFKTLSSFGLWLSDPRAVHLQLHDGKVLLRQPPAD
jgi:Na+(H+)/acetate symporter ActP